MSRQSYIAWRRKPEYPEKTTEIHQAKNNVKYTYQIETLALTNTLMHKMKQ